ncbi:UTRA domain-containing protein [Clostridioides difficile]|uniref:UTRA domain-containing protein n=1 Tax=Clostridioides difficile TaxID=1496 RepID=UPI000B3C0948|nr:UTRA domain-containing protein [Clostridioides difficile]TLE43202.1 UTRA domain-containing protein [Clostridioides difficile]
MGRAKYYDIYIDLKNRIENKEYLYQDLLPSEYKLIEEYSCSRNTIRRAIQELANQGYVQSKHGKGVFIIYRANTQSEFLLGGTESFKESAIRNNKEYKTKVVHFEEIIIDDKKSQITNFEVGTEVYYIQRVRILENKPSIIDHNYFMKDIVKDINEEIAYNSIYEYMENELNETIVTTKRTMTVEKATKLDKKYLELGDYNCVAVVSNNTYNAQGIMFEYTQSRHIPDGFIFFQQSQRINNIK